MKKVECTQKRLNQIMRVLLEVGFTGLDSEERQIMTAFDAGTLSIKAR